MVGLNCLGDKDKKKMSTCVYTDAISMKNTSYPRLFESSDIEAVDMRSQIYTLSIKKFSTGFAMSHPLYISCICVPLLLTNISSHKC